MTIFSDLPWFCWANSVLVIGAIGAIPKFGDHVNSFGAPDETRFAQQWRLWRPGFTALAASFFMPSLEVASNCKLTVLAVSHNTQGSDYTTQTPSSSNTNCSAIDSSVNCNTTTYGGGTQTNAVYRLNEVVTANGMRYKLTRTARWRWSSLNWLNDGESFPAEIKGKHMYITCHRGGNQGKKETIKYEILDIRPI